MVGTYPFYKGSDAIEINHGDYTLRYSELKLNKYKNGDKIIRGEQIGVFAKMHNIKEIMIHLEMYSNNAV